MRAHPIGTLAFDDNVLENELAALERLATTPCVGYAHGGWSKCILALRATGERAARVTADGEIAPHVMERVRATFRMEHVKVVQLFAAANGGFVRPHVDWHADSPLATRLHVPLRTSPAALSSEDDVVFRMECGEIWFLDASRPHSGGCFAEEARLHLVIDLDPAVMLERAFVDESCYVPAPCRGVVALPELTSSDRNAIDGLAEVVTETNLSAVLDFLSAIHFQRRVDCATAYDWLLEIAERTGELNLVARAREYRRMYLTPFATPAG
jgi:L-proline cis-4-hydroxylase